MVNIQQELKNLITKYKDNPNNDVIVNDLCRLYFEIEEQNKKESPFEGSQLKEVKDDVITEQSLFALGFERSESGKSFILQLPNEFTFRVEINVICIHFSIEQKQHISNIPFIKHETTISELKELIKIIFRVEL